MLIGERRMFDDYIAYDDPSRGRAESADQRCNCSDNADGNIVTSHSNTYNAGSTVRLAAW